MKTKNKRLWFKIFSLTMAFSLTVFSVSCKPEAGGSTANKPTYEEIGDNAQITLSQTTKNMLVGDTDILTVDYTGKKGTPIEWASDNQSVVIVTDGAIEAVDEGTANITVTCGNATATCAVSVSYGSTLPELVNGYGFEEEYTIYKNSSLYFAPAIAFRGKSYADGSFEMKSSNPDVVEVVSGKELRAKSQVGEAVITVTASWRKFNAENTAATLSKNFTVSVEESSYISLESGAANELELYTLAEFEGETYENSVDFVPVVYEDGKAVENATVSSVVANEEIASLQGGKLTGKQYGETAVLLTYQKGEKTYHKTVSVHVTRPSAKFENTVKYFSAYTGTYKDGANGYQDKKLASLFGEDVTLYDAYLGEEALTLTADGRVLGVACEEDGVMENQITVGNLIWQYEVTLETYGVYICQAEDLKVFEAVTVGANTETKRGYCVLGKDIDASDLVLAHGAFEGDKPYPNATKDGGFSGTFDGQGHTVFNLKAPNTGLFFQMKNATLKNVAFVDVTVEGYYKTLLAHRIFDCSLENVYIRTDKWQEGGSVLCSDQIKNTSLTNVVIENEISKEDVASGNKYSIAGLAARNYYEEKGEWENVYTLTPLPFEMSYREMFTPNEGENKNGQGTWAYFDYLAVAENATKEQVADYWTWSVYSDDHQKAEMVTIKGVKGFSSRAQMAFAENDLTAFENSEYWLVEYGVPVWKGLAEEQRTEKGFVVKTNVAGNAFTDSISFAWTDIFGNSLPLEATVSLVNDTDSGVVSVSDNVVTKNPEYVAVGDRKIAVKVTAEFNGVQLEKTVEITLREDLENREQKTLNGLYIEADGTIVGLSADEQAKLQNASYRTEKNGTDIAVTNGKLSVEFLTDVTLGANASIVAITEDTVYTLHYRYVTKTLSVAEDLRVFTVKPAEVAEGETAHATEVSGYYVLTNNIDASDLVLDAHSGYKAKWYPTPDYDKGFTGTFDGQGYTVSNLTTKGEGLFSVVYNGTIKNVAFVNGKVEAGGGYTAFFAFKMILSELSNVYVQVTSLNGNKTNHSILSCSSMHKVKMTNVVVDYKQTEFDAGEYYSALGLIDGKTTTVNQGVWKNVYSFGAAPLASDTGYIMVASNQSETEVTALKDKFLSGQTVTTLTVDGVKSYANAEAMKGADEDLSGFDAAYWDIQTGVPVWKTK